MLNPLTFLHSSLIQLLVVVRFGDIFWLCLTFKVQKWCVILRNAFVILDISKNVEEILIVILGVFNLIGRVVLQVAIGAALARLVRLVLLSTHAHDVLDAALNHRSLKVLNAEDELEEITKFALRVIQDVLKAEEVDGLVSCLSDVQPVIKPQLVTVGALLLEVFPPW